MLFSGEATSLDFQSISEGPRILGETELGRAGPPMAAAWLRDFRRFQSGRGRPRSSRKAALHVLPSETPRKLLGRLGPSKKSIVFSMHYSQEK